MSPLLKVTGAISLLALIGAGCAKAPAQTPAERFGAPVAGQGLPVTSEVAAESFQKVEAASFSFEYPAAWRTNKSPNEGARFTFEAGPPSLAQVNVGEELAPPPDNLSVKEAVLRIYEEAKKDPETVALTPLGEMTINGRPGWWFVATNKVEGSDPELKESKLAFFIIEGPEKTSYVVTAIGATPGIDAEFSRVHRLVNSIEIP